MEIRESPIPGESCMRGYIHTAIAIQLSGDPKCYNGGYNPQHVGD
jgi:hypothetical protein